MPRTSEKARTLQVIDNAIDCHAYAYALAESSSEDESTLS